MSMIIFSRFILFFTITTSVLTTLRTWAASPALLHPDELKALEEIASTLGITKLNLGYGDPCDIKKLKIDVSQDPGSENIIACDCSFNNSRTCHITELTLKTLPPSLPPSHPKLDYLLFNKTLILNLRKQILGFLGISSEIPRISFSVRMSVRIPLFSCSGNSKMTFLCNEEKQLNNTLTQNRRSTKFIILVRNYFTGTIVNFTCSKLVSSSLRSRISDNRLNGIIPSFIGEWPQLKKIYLYASGLKGPIPYSIFRLKNLQDLRVSDITGIDSFPNITSKSMITLYLSSTSHLDSLFSILRNVSLSGQIPSYVWYMKDLKTL
ncbi:unnamed protein product [Brassica oleracea]